MKWIDILTLNFISQIVHPKTPHQIKHFAIFFVNLDIQIREGDSAVWFLYICKLNYNEWIWTLEDVPVYSVWCSAEY